MRIKDHKPKTAKPKEKILDNKTLMLRITDQGTLKALEHLQEDFKMTQSSKAITEMINSYGRLKQKLEELEQFSNNMTRDYWELRHALEAKKESEQTISRILEGKES